MNASAAGPGDFRQQLQPVVEQLTGLIQRLHGLLEEEHTALTSQDTDRLRAIANSKRLCAECIETAETERRSLCQSAGFDFDESGMLEFVRWCDPGASLEASWKDVMQAAKRSESMNRVNAAIGHARLQQVSDALAVMNGANPGQSLYDAKGGEATGFERRALAQI